jgi:hypothetical protein
MERRNSGSGQGHKWRKHNGRGRKSGPLAAGPGGFCVCQDCGHRIEHAAGQPCNQQKCPKCGAQMLREQ